MAANNKLEPVARNTFNCASLTGSYAVVSSGGFSVDLAIYKLYNGGSNDIDISYNGVVDHDIIPAGGTLVLDVQANKEGDRAAWPAGREMFVKGTASAGTLYEIGYSTRRS
jgi:hypothetical protein